MDKKIHLKLPRKLPSPEKVRQLYIEKSLSTTQIAKLYGCAPSAAFQSLKRNNIPTRSNSEGIKLAYATGRMKHQNWKGGRRRKVEGGYIRILAHGHHRVNRDGYVLEHIMIWEKTHGKELPEGWVIHHINGIKDDNRPRNLLALPRGKHHNQLVAQALKERIRELEVDVKLLEKALDSAQLIFRVTEN